MLCSSGARHLGWTNGTCFSAVGAIDPRGHRPNEMPTSEWPSEGLVGQGRPKAHDVLPVLPLKAAERRAGFGPDRRGGFRRLLGDTT